MAIKVLIIHNRIHLGGPLYIVAYLSKYLGPEFEVKVLIGPSHQDELSAADLLQKMGVNYTILPRMHRSVNPFSDLTSFLQIRKIIREFKPQILHTHTAKAGVLGRLAGWACRVPVMIHTFHGHLFHSYFSWPVTRAIKATERFFANRSTAIVAISDMQKHELGTVYKIAAPEKIHVIPLGLDLERFAANSAQKRHAFRGQYKLTDNQVAFALIGRFAPIKNHHLLLEAIVLLKNEFPSHFEQMVFFLVGDGPLKASFTRQLLAHNIPFSEKCKNFPGAGVVLTSWIADIDEIMAGFDAVIITSRNEGTPLSLIEAQAAGVPVISTRVGGVEDIVADNQTGILVPPDDAKSLANAFVQFVASPDERKQMGLAGSLFVKSRFSYQRLVQDTAGLYQSLLKKASQRRQ